MTRKSKWNSLPLQHSRHVSVEFELKICLLVVFVSSIGFYFVQGSMRLAHAKRNKNPNKLPSSSPGPICLKEAGGLNKFRSEKPLMYSRYCTVTVGAVSLQQVLYRTKHNTYHTSGTIFRAHFLQNNLLKGPLRGAHTAEMVAFEICP